MTQRLDLAGLSARVVGDDDATTTVVLLHGFGAPGDDLVALGDALEIPNVRYVFPAAPVKLPRMYGNGLAWWMIDMEKLQDGYRTGNVAALLAEIPDGLAFARETLIAFLAALQTELAIPDDRLVLGGFSQGAMLTLDVALHREAPIAGLVQLSGTLIAESVWQPRMERLEGLPIIQSHGKQDMVLPFVVATTLRDRLVAAGAKHQWQPFTGGHEIPSPVLAQVGTFLASRARAKRE